MRLTGKTYSTGTVSSNALACYVTFKDWSVRTSRSESQGAILEHLQHEFANIPEARVLAFPPPPFAASVSAGGFQMEVLDVGSVGLRTGPERPRRWSRPATAKAILQALNTTFSASVPQLYLDIDRSKVKSLNLPLSLVFNTLQTYLGSTFVNNFNQFGRTYQVRLASRR